jgi:histidinol-phosphate/aromatic aminotransferase/cobyric acid decarboxylase-like protein
MSVRVTIEAASKAEAELIAEALPVRVEAESWRGFGVIRIGVKTKAETNALIEAVSRTFHEHSLKWARVRYDDEERVFKGNGNGHRAA